jgi:hypothetical protein
MTLLLLMIGCGAEEKDTANTAPPLNQDSAVVEDCNAAAPTVEEIVVTNGGMETFDEGTFPTVLVEVRARDTDNDLDHMRVDLWFDTVVDGAVDTAGERIEGALAELKPEACSVGRGNYGLRVAVGDGRLEVNTRYEFGAIAYDAHDTPSALGFGTGVTPKADGTDGDAARR